ncbi:hypothetical protein GBAR_LOCUS2194 [Geodia barretti]|nr:hypothetical protein GBAR_LOCUS2194 [Geodia barretti]
MGVPPSTAVESWPQMQTAPPPAHDHHHHHHHRDDHRHHRAPNVPPPASNEPSQPPPPTQQAMPQFFNPSAFAHVSSMTGPHRDPMDDTQSTVSEMSQEVSRINSHQMLPAPRAPVMGSYNRLRHGRRVAYPQQELSGPPPRHK